MKTTKTTKMLIMAVNICPRGFQYSQKKPYKKINKMLDYLLDFCVEATSEKDIDIAFAQFRILQGNANVADYKNDDPSILKAVIAAEKWLNCEVEDEALFI